MTHGWTCLGVNPVHVVHVASELVTYDKLPNLTAGGRG